MKEKRGKGRPKSGSGRHSDEKQEQISTMTASGRKKDAHEAKRMGVAIVEMRREVMTAPCRDGRGWLSITSRISYIRSIQQEPSGRI